MLKYLITVSLLTTLSYGQTSSGWKTLNQSKYSIQYPSTWELNQKGQMGTSFILFSPLESERDQFRENVNLLIQDFTGKNVTMDNYTEFSEKQIKTLVPNSELILSKRMKTDKGEYHKLIYSGDQGIYQLKFEQYYWFVGEKVYVLTLTCEKDKFSNYQQIGEKTLDSFRLKK